MRDLTGPRSQAAATLADTCTITRAGADTMGSSGIVAGTPTTIYSGPCSVSPAVTGRRSNDGADDRLVDTRIIRLPENVDALTGTAVATGDPADILPGDQVAVTGRDDIPDLVVAENLARTTQVLRRIRCTVSVDAPGVPR